MTLLISGLITGLVFGFLLQRAGVVRYDKQIGALRLLDMTIVKFMFSSILVGMVGIYLFRDIGMVRLLYMPTVLGENIIGGLIFGIGWGLLGYCPGTQGGALGEGRLDALWGIFGMILGAALYAEFYPAIAHNPAADIRGKSLVGRPCHCLRRPLSFPLAGKKGAVG